MKTGRISYNVMQRSIRRPIKSGSGLLPGFVQYKDCAEHSVGEETDWIAVNALQSEVVWTDSIIELLFYRCCNQIWSQKAQAVSISAVFLLDTQTEESWLASQIKKLCFLCSKENISLGQISASVSEQVKQPVLTLNCSGWKKKQQSQEDSLKRNGALLAVGHSGMAGAGLLAECFRKELGKRYSGGFLDGAKDFLNELSLKNAIACAAEENDFLSESFLFPVQEGGVFAALWYMADGLGCGFEVDWKQIPIKQETVEICEYYRINPYQLMGDGMLLAAVLEPEKLMKRWEKAGYQSAVIGYLNDGKARILRNDEEIRYLDKPAQDPLADGGYRMER